MILSRIIQKTLNLIGYKITRMGTKRDAEAVQHVNIVNHFSWLNKFNLKTIIDVGANAGQFAQKILVIAPNATLHCFEPLVNVCQELKMNLSHYPNVLCYNFGLGESDDEMDMYLNEYNPSSSLLPMLELHKNNFDFAVNVTKEKIKIKPLDSFFNEKIEGPLLVKIDVQGYEMPVLKGGDKVIEQAQVIIIETSFYPLYAGQPLFHDIYIYLTDKGFSYAGNIEQLISPKDSLILQADAVFIKSIIKD